MQIGSRGRIEGLDLLRGIAIGLVMLRHAWPGTFGGAGIVGVVVFFALSGYLITTILTRDIERYGRIRYGHFYRNRILRLVPALLLTLLGYAVVTLLFFPAEDSEILASVFVGMTYIADLPLIDFSGRLGHLWTLATEEQFYLIWPTLLMLGLRRGRLGALVSLAAGAIFLTCAISVFLFSSDLERIYILPSSWAIVMVIGAASALWAERVASVLPRAGRSRAAVSWLALGTLLAISLLPEIKEWAITYLLLGPIIGVCSVVLIFHLRDWKVVPYPLARRVLLPLGTISYAAYLWNNLITGWLHDSGMSGLLASIMSIILTIAAAAMSWFVVERPVQRWKGRLDQRERIGSETPPAAPARTLP